MRPLSTFVKPWTIVLPLAMGLSGCDSTLVVEDYDRTCQTSTDCVSVLIGDMCDCACDYAAISQSALPKYQTDSADARDSCVGIKQCGPCLDPTGVACTAGQCTMAQ